MWSFGAGMLAVALAALAVRPAQAEPVEPKTVASLALERDFASAAKSRSLTKALGIARTGELARQGIAALDFAIPQAGCIVVLATAAPSLSNLSLVVKIAGVEVASDRISGVHPAAEWCSPNTTTAVVELHAFEGAGSFQVGLFEQPSPDGGSKATVGGSGRDLLANRLRQLHGQFAAQRNPASALIRGNLEQGKERSIPVRLRSGRCYTAIAVGDCSVRALEVSFVDATGKVIAKSSPMGAFAAIETKPCLTTSGDYTIRVRMAEGAGQFGLQVFSD